MSRNTKWDHILEAFPSSGTSYCFGITRLVLLIFKLRCDLADASLSFAILGIILN